MASASVTNINSIYGILVVAGFGIGGIVVPASIITTIICPDDLIATASALTLAIRVIGGVVGYTIYYNALVSKLTPILTAAVAGAMVSECNITSVPLITEAITLTAVSLPQAIGALPGVTPSCLAAVTLAGQEAWAEGYSIVYYVSIAFGIISIIASAFLGDIEKFMDDHVAVVIS